MLKIGYALSALLFSVLATNAQSYQYPDLSKLSNCSRFEVGPIPSETSSQPNGRDYFSHTFFNSERRRVGYFAFLLEAGNGVDFSARPNGHYPVVLRATVRRNVQDFNVVDPEQRAKVTNAGTITFIEAQKLELIIRRTAGKSDERMLGTICLLDVR